MKTRKSKQNKKTKKIKEMRKKLNEGRRAKEKQI